MNQESLVRPGSKAANNREIVIDRSVSASSASAKNRVASREAASKEDDKPGSGD